MNGSDRIFPIEVGNELLNGQGWFAKFVRDMSRSPISEHVGGRLQGGRHGQGTRHRAHRANASGREGSQQARFLQERRRRRRRCGGCVWSGRRAPHIKPEELEDDPDRLFRDMTDWSVVDATGVAGYRYNDRELHRAWADNAPKTRQFMMDNYVRFARIDGTHQGGGMTRARAARAMMKLADKTDIKAGTVSPQDRGDPAGERHSHFAPMRQVPGVAADSLGAPGWVWGGFSIARPMEVSAREKGVRVMLNRHMDELIRERPFSGTG